MAVHHTNPAPSEASSRSSTRSQESSSRPAVAGRTASSYGERSSADTCHLQLWVGPSEGLRTRVGWATPWRFDVRQGVVWLVAPVQGPKHEGIVRPCQARVRRPRMASRHGVGASATTAGPVAPIRPPQVPASSSPSTRSERAAIYTCSARSSSAPTSRSGNRRSA